MAITAPGDVFSPQVIAAVVTRQLYALTPLLNTGYVADARTSAIRGGDNTSVLFPYIKRADAALGVQVNPRTGSAVTADEFTISYDSANLVSKIISYENDEKALRMAAQTEDPDAWLAMDVIKQMRAKVQLDIIAAGLTGAYDVTPGENQATIKGILKAITSVWGEHAYDDGAPLCILNSKVAYDLQTSTEVAQTGLYGFNTGGVPTGTVFQIAGINFFVSDQIASSDDRYENLIVMPGALELWADMRIDSGVQRKPGTTAYVSDFWFEYACHLRYTLPVPAISYNVGATIDQEA